MLEHCNPGQQERALRLFFLIRRLFAGSARSSARVAFRVRLPEGEFGGVCNGFELQKAQASIACAPFPLQATDAEGNADASSDFGDAIEVFN